MAKIADFGLSRGEEVYVKKTMVSVLGRTQFFIETFVLFQFQPAEGSSCLGDKDLFYFMHLHAFMLNRGSVLLI